MRLTIERSVLSAALASCARTIVKRSNLAVATHILVDASDGTVRLSATDLDMEVSFVVPADVQVPGRTAMLAEVFAGFVDRTTVAAVTLTTQADGRVVVKAGRSQVTVPTHDSADYPAMAGFGSEDMVPAFDLAGEDVSAMLKACMPAASTDATRGFLNGVFMHSTDDDGRRMTFACADGALLAIRSHEIEDNAPECPGFILPTKAAGEIDRLAKGRVAVTASKRQAQFVFDGGATLTTKLVEGSFPNYATMVPSAEDPCVVNREMLAAAIGRAALADDGRDYYTRFDIRDGVIVIDREIATRAAVYDEVPCKGELRAMFAVSHQKMTTALRSIGGDDVEIVAGRQVKGELRGAGSATVVALRPVGRDDAVFIVAPLLLKTSEPAVVPGEG